MKVWGIIATILLVIAIGLGGWLYMQNKGLKDDKSKLQSDLSAANSAASAARSASDSKITKAGTKINAVLILMNGQNNPETPNQLAAPIAQINDPTITADYNQMKSTKGDGSKLIKDLVTAAAADLK